ncbi:hypothetical protein M4I21_10545 [Cellulophaga sp. 20_2_10]|uniref:hypothetical protein n=1 Tax=Cellulophaga sp. 20_2_10 TaxID=2942476 RepID=UPI00201A8266|nr:hypothetical protein [Cellulophaga sp. 20_2_10]MCL5246248.1 hypothetical protein [Cellulophaga sp. 20_2_10]
MKLYLKLTLTLSCILLGTSCVELNTSYDTFYINPDVEDVLEIPIDADIKNLLSEPSVCAYVTLDDKKLFVPVNYRAIKGGVGTYRVKVGDLIITEEVNNYNPIRFFSNQEDLRADGIRNTYLFFLPSEDSLAITKEKLIKQHDRVDYADSTSIISGFEIIHFTYNNIKKGFDLFLSQKMPSHNANSTTTELFYENIDILRMAKHLNDENKIELNWKKLHNVVPVHFPRYFNSLIDTVVAYTKQQPNNFRYTYDPNDLLFDFSIVKDSSLVTLLKDLRETPVKEEIYIKNKYAKESLRVLKDHAGYRSDYIEILYTEDKNTFFMDDGFDGHILYFLPDKELLFVLNNDNSKYYNNEIYYKYFQEVLLPKL